MWSEKHRCRSCARVQRAPFLGLRLAGAAMVPMAVVFIAFLMYTVSAFTAAVMSFVWVPSVPEASCCLRALRIGAVLGLFLLAFGTGCDNARTVAGLFSASIPHGVFDLKNTDKAQDFLRTKYPDGVQDANYYLSWFCFFCHESLGGTFVLPGVYLWAAASFLPGGREQEGRCSTGICSCAAWLQRKRESKPALVTMGLCALGLALCLLGSGVGMAGFIMHTAQGPLILKWNGALGLWTWGCSEEHKNHNGLFGVFLSSYVWIAVGLLLWQWRGVRWFFALQLLSFVGQGVSAVAGEAMFLPSNFFEQVVTWALLIMGRNIQRDWRSIQGLASESLLSGAV